MMASLAEGLSLGEGTGLEPAKILEVSYRFMSLLLLFNGITCMCSLKQNKEMEWGRGHDAMKLYGSL